MRKITYLILSLILLLACSDDKGNQTKKQTSASITQPKPDDFSSPKSLFVDYVSSFTGGVVSVSSDIKLKLTKSVADSLVGTSLSNIFSISPEIEGITSWEDNKTIVFQPTDWLKANQKYEVKANLKPLIKDLDKEKETFKFVFQTLIQNFEVTTGGIKLYSNNDLSKVKVEGQIQTADIVNAADIQKTITATQNGSPLTLNWENTGKDNVYNFTIENVSRVASQGIVDLVVDGKPIAVDKSEKLTVEIPALDDYKVVSSSIIRGQDNYISILFSDPLDARQNLTGLVKLSGTKNIPRVVINSNELKVYPTQEIKTSTELTINQAVKNIAGFKLKSDYKTTLQFTQVKPEIELISDNNKSILPSSKGLVLPFRAVALSAVDVTVIKIFEENVLQYLQVNSIGGQNQLTRVGRPIVRKTIPLNTSGVTNLNSWNKFTLNLEDVFKSEPGAIYQIQLGFQRKHSLYFCGENNQIETLDEVDEWGAEEESSYWDNYEYYYSSNYSWEDRNNPCSDSYYGNRKSVKKMLFASDLGIIAKRRDQGELSVFVTDLTTTKTLSGVDIEVYDYQQQLIASGKTDSEGKTKIAVGSKPYVLIGRKDKQIGYLKIDDGSSLSLSNFDVSGTSVKNGLKGFVYGERGVWRPADTVHLGFIVEDITRSLPENHPVVMELYNPNNQLTFRKVSSEAVGNMYRFDFITASDAPTGNWRATAKVGGASFSKTVKIETIKPNRLKVDLKFDKDRFSASDRNISADLNVRWLSGAKASNLKAEYELKLSPVKTTFKNYNNFSFDDPSKSFYSTRETVFEGRVNDQGFAKVNIDLGKTKNAPGALTASLYGKVYEEGGEFSISNTNIPYYPYTSFVGLQTPEGDKRGMLLTDKDHTVNIATLDADGNPVSRKDLRVEVYKLNWRWWWDQSYDDISNYVGSYHRDPIETEKISTTNGKGTYKLRVDHPSWGRYFVRVEDPVSGHSAGQIVFLDWPGWAGKGKRGELGGASMLDFAVEKEEYKVGEKMVLSIPSTSGNKILVSLESGSEVLQTFWVDTKDENTNISFDATSDMAPNVYAHITMIQPHGQEKNDLPIRLYGVHSIKVVDPDTELSPVINMPKELRPEQNYTIEISEKAGKAMAYTIAIVDEGLLDITNFKTPSPWSSFYAREALGIKTWDIYDDVMGAFTGKMDHLLAIGGDGELKPKEEKEANRFKPVVKFIGPFYLEKSKTAKHSLKMPQYIGSVKTMVVAAANGAYGSADVATPVKQPLMVLATLPRVAGPGETMKLPVNIFALDDKIKNVDVSVEVSGMLTLTGQKTTSVSFSASGDKVIYFDVKAKEALGIGKVKVTAKSGSLETSYDIELNVMSRNPHSTFIDDKIVSNGATWDINYSPLGLLGENTGAIEISSLPPLNIEKRLNYLIQYPHGCIEQTTSSVFSQLFLKELVTLTEKREQQIQRNVEAGIKRLKSFQISSGGFAYWPGNDYASNWGSNYAGHFMIEAKKAGYAVPEGMIANWISFQTKKADNWSMLSTDDDDDLIQAYRLYTLAIAGSPSLGAMNRMKENGKVRREAKWRLALAYAEAGYDSQAANLIEGLSIQADSVLRDYRYSFGSQTRDKAMVMETLLGLDKKEKAFEILMDIAKEMGDNSRWMSTQTTAYCFIAIAKYTKGFGLEAQTNVTVDVGGKISEAKGSDFVNIVSLTDADTKTSIKVSNLGDAPVFARLIRTGVPLEGTETESERNIKLVVNYLDMDGSPININSLKQGTNFKAQVKVINPGLKGRYDELALTQIFPSGWEILNTRLDGSEEQNKIVDYMDIRDDRVMHYFDLKPNGDGEFTVLLNASYQGMYYLPAVKVEAMYDNSIFANKSGKWVKVIPEN